MARGKLQIRLVDRRSLLVPFLDYCKGGSLLESDRKI